MTLIATMKVKHGSGFMIINRSDFDPGQHKEYVEIVEKPEEKIVKTKAPTMIDNKDYMITYALEVLGIDLQPFLTKKEMLEIIENPPVEPDDDGEITIDDIEDDDEIDLDNIPE